MTEHLHPETMTETSTGDASPHGIPFAQNRPMGETEAAAEATRILARAFQSEQQAPAPAATYFRDPTPVPTVGTAAPVPQYGRPPMSQGAVDKSVMMLSAGVASLPIGGVTIGIMLASGHADPTVVGLMGAAPVALLLALSRLLRRGKEVMEAAPAVHHHHYEGPVVQDHSRVTTTTKGVIARTRINP